MVEGRHPQVAHVIDGRQRLVGQRPDRHTDRTGAGIGHQVEPAPASQGIKEENVELVRRVVVGDLAQPGRDDEQCLERLRRQGLDDEGGDVVGDPAGAAGRRR